MLLLLSDDISLNSGLFHKDTMEYWNGWNIFKKKDLNFTHLTINTLLPKIEELRFIAKSSNAAVIGICESKLDASVLEQEISIHNYKILCCTRNRHGGAARGLAI